MGALGADKKDRAINGKVIGGKKAIQRNRRPGNDKASEKKAKESKEEGKEGSRLPKAQGLSVGYWSLSFQLFICW